ncbi:MAG TPA: hypothetical protein VNN10_07975 [Dehalococcoidia bacterium]|nr:hypothetical protein [Dehalococcoidia bacterium]
MQALFDDYWGDRGRLRSTRFYTGSEPENYVAVVVAGDGSLVRARVASGQLYVSRVTSPGAGSTYSSWTDLNACADAGVAVFRQPNNDTLTLVYVDTGGLTLRFKQSTDHGASWGAAGTVATAGAAVTHVAGAANGSGDMVVFWCEGATVYRARANFGSGFGARTAWTNTIASCAGLATEYQGDWGVVVCGTAPTSGDAKVWACVYGDGLDQGANTWSSLIEVTTAVNGSGVSYLSPAVEFSGVYRLWFVEKYTGSLAYSRLQESTLEAGQNFKQEVWAEPVAAPADVTGDYGVAAAVEADGDCWLVQPAGVWYAPATPAAYEASGDVLEAVVDQDGEGARVRLVLDNSHGRYNRGAAEAAKVGPGRRLRLSFGFHTSAGGSPEVSAGPGYWVVRVAQEWAPGRSVVVVEARDAWHLLESWRARRQLQWAAGTKSVNQLLGYVFARAGLEYGNGTSSAAITGLQPAFTIYPGESGAAAVRRLLAKVPDRLRLRSGLALTVYPQASDASEYAYGTEHVVLGGRYGAAPARVNRARVFGASVFDERFDFGGYQEAGEVVRNVVDIGLTTTGQAGERAGFELRAAQVEAEELAVVVPMNVGQEVWDVVTVTDAVVGLSAAKRRVVGLVFRHVAGYGRKQAVYELELRLGAA